MDLLIGIDLGTSAIKGVLVSTDGRIVAYNKYATKILHPHPGYAEFSPSEYHGLVCDLIRSLAAEARQGDSVEAISMASASGSTILIDKSGNPVTNAVSWTDERAQKNDVIGHSGLNADDVHRITGWPWSGGFPLGHLLWFKHKAPGLYKKMTRICMDSDYILYRLTGKWAIDRSTATTSYLQNQVDFQWHLPYLNLLGIGEENLSAIMPSGTFLGNPTAEAVRDTGLSAGTKVILGAFDHPCTARGTGIFDTGDLLLSCGTSWVGFSPVRERDIIISNKLISDPFLSSSSGQWGAMFSLPGIGKKIDRCIDINRVVIERAAFCIRKEIEKLANADIKVSNITMAGGASESPVIPQIVSDSTGLE